jgi:hypothetical protein
VTSKVTVFFKAEQRGSASDAVRTLGFTPVQGGGYVFDDVKYSPDNRLVELTRGRDTYHVPVANILLVRVAPEGE